MRKPREAVRAENETVVHARVAGVAKCSPKAQPMMNKGSSDGIAARISRSQVLPVEYEVAFWPASMT